MELYSPYSTGIVPQICSSPRPGPLTLDVVVHCVRTLASVVPLLYPRSISRCVGEGREGRGEDGGKEGEDGVKEGRMGGRRGRMGGRRGERGSELVNTKEGRGGGIKTQRRWERGRELVNSRRG